MLNISRIIVLFILIVPHLVLAISELENKVQDAVRKELGNDKILILISNKFNISKHDPKEIQELKIDETHKKVHIHLKDGMGRNVSFIASYSEGKLLPVPNGIIRSGSVIGDHDIEEQLVENTFVRGSEITERSELIGKIAKRALIAGRPISRQDVRSEAIIEKGKAVTIAFVKNGLNIETMGKALESGGADDLIKVKNENTGKNIMAKVVDNNRVVIER